MGAFSALDFVIFFASLLAVMAAGLWVSRKESSAVEFYLAGRNARWWGVAASIFGSNVSANHVAGMMGIGFSVGFACVLNIRFIFAFFSLLNLLNCN